MLNLLSQSASKGVSAVELPKSLQHLINGPAIGVPAPGDRISVDTPMSIVQRPLHKSYVIQHIEKSQCVDWNLFGYVTAVRNQEGNLEMINGQHRTSLVKTLLPGCKEIPAHIIDSNDSEYVAKLFGLMNGGATRNVTREERLWADVLAKDPKALHVKAVLEKCDLACGMVNAAEGRIDVKLANFEKCISFGSEEALVRAINLIRQAWPGKTAIDNLLSGLTRLFALPQYKDLSNNKIATGKHFEKWFVDIVPAVLSWNQLQFKVYRNNPRWYEGIAYGIAKQFRTYMVGQGLVSPALKTIKDIYTKGIDGSISDDDEE